MKRIAIKTALITVCAIIILGAAVFGIWILGFPQSMATVCEKTGNFSFAVTCASIRYKYTGEVGDLARCAEDGVMSGKDKYILKYGEMLISDEGFEDLCTAKDETLSAGEYGEYRSDYKTYICGNVSAAQYRAGDIQKAVNTAGMSGVKGYTKLVIAVAENADAESAAIILTALENSSAQSGSYEYLENLKTILINIGD